MSLLGNIGSEAAADHVIRMIDEELEKEPPAAAQEALENLRERVDKEIKQPSSTGWY